jgi:hypothetical protein
LSADVNTLLGAEHDISDSATTGGFHGENITGKAAASISTPPTGYGRFGWKVISGVTELFYEDDAGNEIQITSAGKILLDLNTLSNNTALIARNAADDGNISMIKVNASDQPEIADGAVLAAAAVSTDGDRTIADIAYCDGGTPTETDSVASQLVKDTVYLAQTAGFVNAWDADNVTGKIFVGAANPPTLQVSQE